MLTRTIFMTHTPVWLQNFTQSGSKENYQGALECYLLNIHEMEVEGNFHDLHFCVIPRWQQWMNIHDDLHLGVLPKCPPNGSWKIILTYTCMLLSKCHEMAGENNFSWHEIMFFSQDTQESQQTAFHNIMPLSLFWEYKWDNSRNNILWDILLFIPQFHTGWHQKISFYIH